MAKKRSTSKERELRREVEMLRAQIKTEIARPVFVEKSATRTIPSVNVGSSKMDLPIKHIRKDLIKTTVFAVFAIGVLIALTFVPVKL